MERGHLFAKFFEGQLLSVANCLQCRKRPDRPEVDPPVLTPIDEGRAVHVHYNLKCTCGKRIGVGFDIPILLLGFLMVRDLLLSYKRQRRSCKAITLHEPKHLLEILSDFNKQISQYPAVHAFTRTFGALYPLGSVGEAPAGLTDHDRVGFGFNAEEWEQFVKRLEGGNSHEQES